MIPMFLKIIGLLLILDLVWITVFFGKPFSKMIEDVQGEKMKINLMGAIVAYILLAASAIFFIPKTKNVYEAFLTGFFTYGVYDSTNYATLKNWDAKLAIVDSLWGGVLFAIIKYFV
jgi:uncharacterized membrane protein